MVLFPSVVFVWLRLHLLVQAQSEPTSIYWSSMYVPHLRFYINMLIGMVTLAIGSVSFIILGFGPIALYVIT